MKNKTLPIIILSLVAVGLGLGGSYLFKRNSNSGSTVADANPELANQEVVAAVAEEGNIKNGDVFGSQATASFKDSAQGYLAAGGLEGEGSHSLLRAGGVSQTVYLTSSVTDLDKFVGMEIKVWGETFSGQEAGWLMDVGRVEVINTVGEEPEE